MEIRWCLSTPGSAECILPVPLSTTVTRVCQYSCRRSLKMYWEAMIKRGWRCAWTLRLSELIDALGGQDRASLKMHLKTKRLSELRDALGGHNWVRLEMDLEAMIVWTRRPWLSEFGDAIGGQDQVNSGMHLEAVIDHVGRYIWRPWSIKIGGLLGGGWSGGNWSEGSQSGGSQSGGSQSGGSQSGGSESGVGRSGGRYDGCCDSIHWLTRICGNEENWVQQGPLKAERLAGSGRQLILGWCSTRCMQYSVYALLGVNSCSWHGEKERDVLTAWS